MHLGESYFGSQIINTIIRAWGFPNRLNELDIQVLQKSEEVAVKVVRRYFKLPWQNLWFLSLGGWMMAFRLQADFQASSLQITTETYFSVNGLDVPRSC